jgi:hypothetical protein
MAQYDPTDELCPRCEVTLLVSTPSEEEPWCPYCDDWRRKTGGTA